MIKQILVETMSFEEIFDLFRQDIPLLNNKIERGNKVYQKKATTYRNTERIYYEPITFSTPRGFTYVIQYFNRGVNFERRHRIGVYYYVKYLHKGGIHAFMISRADKTVEHLVQFIPHFFDRYRDRFLKDSSIPKDKVIDTYIRRNLKRVLRMERSIKYPNCSYCYSEDGLSLCELHDGLMFVYKTFIPWDDLGPNKKEQVMENKDGLKELVQSGFELKLPEEFFI